MGGGEENPQGYYLYCIVRTGQERTFDVSSVDGDGNGVTTIPFMDLAAVASPSSRTRYQVSRQHAMAHQLVLERVMGEYTLLPIRFGTVARSRDDVVEKLLKRKFGEFHGLLNYLEGRVELGLKVLWDRDSLFKQILEDYPIVHRLHADVVNRSPAESHYDRIQLGQMVERAVDEMRDQEAAALLAILRPLAADIKVNKPIVDNMVLNAAFLVPVREQQAFDARVNELEEARSGRIIFKYVGPVPPYNFVNVVVQWDS